MVPPKQAPKGLWIVATGEAAARRSPPTRNPWSRFSVIPNSPQGGEGWTPLGYRSCSAASNRINAHYAADTPLHLRGRIGVRRRHPRVSLRTPGGELRFTRGYTPSPRRGETAAAIISAEMQTQGAVHSSDIGGNELNGTGRPSSPLKSKLGPGVERNKICAWPNSCIDMRTHT
jgi:hypothetical protein